MDEIIKKDVDLLIKGVVASYMEIKRKKEEYVPNYYIHYKIRKQKEKKKESK